MKRSPRTYVTGLLALLVLALLGTTPATAQNVQTCNDEVDQQEALVHYSLYYENFKNENYMDALPDLQWVLAHAPCAPSGKDTNFERAVATYDSLATRTDDPAKKREYLDSALVIFDRVVPVLQEAGVEIDPFIWTRNKGRFIQEHLDVLEDVKGEAIEAYRQAYEMEPDRVEPYYLDVILADYYSEGDIGSALDFLRELNDTRGDEEGVKELVKKYFTVIPVDEQITFLEEQLEEDPDNLEVIQQLFTLYQQEDERDKMLDLAPRLLEMDPNPKILRLLISMYLEDGDAPKARELFTQLENMPGVEMTALDYYNMGIMQQNLGNFGQANTFYRRALDADSNFTQALKAIADLYATAVSTCGVPDRKDKAVFWLVADAYSRAGDNSGAARYRAVFPSAEDIFYVQEWTEGSTVSYSYSCKGLTISGSTTVRKAS